jgi:peroxiredoxin Q/BCP
MPTPLPQPGESAPDFSGLTQAGEAIGLADFHGRPLVLFFYPKDATPGCTTEACGFRDEHAALKKAGAAIVGISPDAAAAHAKFAAKFSLPYPLLADGQAVASAYGVWGEKSLYGRKYLGVTRTTFLIDRQGRIARVFAKVKPDGHAAEVLAAVRELP